MFVAVFAQEQALWVAEAGSSESEYDRTHGEGYGAVLQAATAHRTTLASSQSQHSPSEKAGVDSKQLGSLGGESMCELE
jgi:hypothetical protein